MPPGEKKVPREQVAVIEQLDRRGAWPQRHEPESLARDRHHARGAGVLGVSAGPAAARRRLGPNDRVRTPIDAFVAGEAPRPRLSFAPDADKRTLIRRAAFDLTGLPPSQEAVDAFLADPTDDAYERMLDRLWHRPDTASVGRGTGST